MFRDSLVTPSLSVLCIKTSTLAKFFRFCQLCAHFWRCHPALFYALLGMTAFLFATFPKATLLIPLTAICSPLLFSRNERGKSRLALAFLFAAAVYAMGIYMYRLPSTEGIEIKGIAKITIQQISMHRTPFGKQVIYRGRLVSFLTHSNEEYIKNGTFSIVLKGPERPLGNRDYILHGKIKESSQGHYLLIPEKGSPWTSVPQSYSIAEDRFQMKELFKQFLEKKIKNRRSFVFLSGIATGVFDDRLMSAEFSRFGLQHIMAISGFHFSMIAFFLGLLLRIFLPQKKAALILLFLLTF